MVEDLSRRHDLVSNLFSFPHSTAEWERYRLRDEQVRFFHENGYLSGIRILREEQVERLRNELQERFDPKHPGNDLFHEFHSNESPDPSRVLFHALGA
jgi:hypothetical protein